MRLARLTRAIAVLAVLSALLVFLWRTGGGSGALPPMRSWHAAERWYDDVGAVAAGAAAARGLALLLTGWLLAVVAVELVATVAGGGATRTLADAIAPRSLQRLVQGLAGLSLTAGLTAAVPSAGILSTTSDGVAVMRLVEDPAGAAGTATMRLVDPAPPAAPAAEPVSVPAPAPAPPATEVVVVEPGDSFWSIAAEHLHDTLGREAEPGEHVAYWRHLIAENRHRLVDPANPDLLFPGQSLVLPPAG